MVRPERLLAAAPLVLRFAPDRRRCAAASNLACGQVVELCSFVCREFESRLRAAGDGEGFSGKESYGAPGEITRRYAPRPFGAALRAFNLACGQVVELGLVVCREFELNTS